MLPRAFAALFHRGANPHRMQVLDQLSQPLQDKARRALWRWFNLRRQSRHQGRLRLSSSTPSPFCDECTGPPGTIAYLHRRVVHLQ